MANDRGLEGPEDPGQIHIPDGLTPLEIIAAEKARREVVAHMGTRPVLTMDQLAELKDERPRAEKEFKLPGDSRQKNRIYFFSIDGTLNGTRLSGCLFAGECIMVQATSFEKAYKLARDGLRETVELALEYWKADQGRLVYASPMDAVQVEVGGGRNASTPGQPELGTDPKLKRMIEHVIGKKPWAG